MKSKILLTIFIFLSAVVLFLTYQTVRERYYPVRETDGEPAPIVKEMKDDKLDETENTVSETPITEENGGNKNEEEIERNQNGQAKINVLDCSDNCERFQESKEDFKYCKKLCGLIPVTNKENRSECANLIGNDLDFCLRDLAVTKKDFKICDEINDGKIRSACNNRIIEDIFEEQ